MASQATLTKLLSDEEALNLEYAKVTEASTTAEACNQ